MIIYKIFTVQALFLVMGVNETAQKHKHIYSILSDFNGTHIDWQNIQYHLADTKQTCKCKDKS